MRIAFSPHHALGAALGLASALVLLASCSAPATMVPPMTVTFHDGPCTYDGPKKVPMGEIALTLKDDGQGKFEQYAVFIATLDPGKTIDDLRQAGGPNQPSWVHQVADLPGQKPGDSSTTRFDLVVCARSRYRA